MKTEILSLLIVAAALCTSACTSLSAAPKTTPAIVYRVSNVYPLNSSPVTIGSTRSEVLSRMGYPSREIAPNFWVYRRYHAVDFSPANRDGCETILVTFTGDAVSDLKLATQSAVDLYTVSAEARRRNLVASGK